MWGSGFRAESLQQVGKSEVLGFWALGFHQSVANSKEIPLLWKFRGVILHVNAGRSEEMSRG